MNKILLVIITFIFSSDTIMSNSVIICGTILNYSYKNISLKISPTDAIWVIAEPIYIKSKTTKEGSFYFKLENIDHVLYENILKIGSMKIYLLFAPGDSINISLNYKNKSDSIIFSGVNATKNYFFNTFLFNLYDSVKTTDFDLNWLEKNQRLLKQYSMKYSIDGNSEEIIDQYLRCYYDNLVFEPNYVSVADDYLNTYNVNNESLTWYYLYYSVISGYFSYKEPVYFHLTTDYDLERGFRLSEKYLSGQIKENYQAYAIGFSLSFNSRSFRKSKKTHEIINGFITNCKNEYVKNNIIEILKVKKMI